MSKEDKNRAIKGMQRWVNDRKADLLRDVVRPAKSAINVVKEKVSS